MSKDLFGMEEPEEGVLQPYVVVQLIPADGWRAIMEDDSGKLSIQSLACFALVELKTDTPDGAPARIARPMVATIDGLIDDVDAIDEFLCLVPPGGVDTNVPRELQGLVDAARKLRAD